MINPGGGSEGFQGRHDRWPTAASPVGDIVGEAGLVTPETLSQQRTGHGGRPGILGEALAIERDAIVSAS